MALVRDGSLVQELALEHGMIHGRDLIPTIRTLCRKSGLPLTSVDAIAIDIGPGSYTGLRVGLATAKALCRFGGPALVGVSSLDAMADAYVAAHPELDPARTILCPALDAKWNQIYYALYRLEGTFPRRIEGPFAAPPSSLGFGDFQPLVFGDATLAFAGELSSAGIRMDPDPRQLRPTAGRVALRGALDYAAGHRDTVVGLEPLYLRPTEAEYKAKKGRT